jgi:hypothetical protein
MVPFTGPVSIASTPFTTIAGVVGLKLEGAFRGEHFLMGYVDADFDYDRGMMDIFFAPNDATGVLFPMVGRRARVCVGCPYRCPSCRGSRCSSSSRCGWRRTALYSSGH